MRRKHILLWAALALLLLLTGCGSTAGDMPAQQDPPAAETVQPSQEEAEVSVLAPSPETPAEQEAPEVPSAPEETPAEHPALSDPQMSPTQSSEPTLETTLPTTPEVSAPQEAPSTEPQEEETMRNIEIVVGETTFTATLADSEAAQALAGLLPLTLHMSELNGNEKYCNLADSLPRSASVPAGIHTGDLMLFGSDCLVLFYKDFSTSYSYTPLGRIDDPAGLAEALGRGSVQVTFQ